ncbi:MAG: hypothetical protein MK193_08680 [Lentisphaeria bacterium]|nr:hypothetical protein [Lentisphaeria bacterium]
MMNQSREYQAYVDEQLSVDQVINLEKRLSKEEIAELEREREYENHISNFINDSGPDCPDDLWAKLKDQMISEIEQNEDVPVPSIGSKQKDIPVVHTPKLNLHDFRVWAIAAMFIINCAFIVAFLQYRNTKNDQPQNLIVFNEDMDQFASPAEFKGNFTDVKQYLHNVGLPVNLRTPSPNMHHKIKALGARVVKVQEQRYGEVYMSCCDKPMLVLIGRKDQQFPNEHIDFSNLSFYHIDSKVIGDLRVWVAGPHKPDGIISLFDGDSI